MWIWRIARLIALPLLMILGWQGAVAAAAATTSSPRPAYSGQAIFEGVIFGLGPVADRFSDVWEKPDMTKAQLAQTRVRIRRLEHTLTRRDPGFFASFQAALQSGAPSLVERALARAQRGIDDAAREPAAGATERLNRSTSPTGTIVAAVVVVAQHLVVERQDPTIKIRAKVRGVNPDAPAWPGLRMSVLTRFEKDQLVATIASRLTAH